MLLAIGAIFPSKIGVFKLGWIPSEMLCNLLPGPINLLQCPNDKPDRNLVLSFNNPLPCAFQKLLKWHTNVTTIFDSRLVFSIMQLRLNGRREQFNDFDRGAFELRAEAHDELMEGCLCSAIVGAAWESDKSETRCCVHDPRGLLLQEERQKVLGANGQ
jgi:hypothetical protein